MLFASSEIKKERLKEVNKPMNEKCSQNEIEDRCEEQTLHHLKIWFVV